MSLLANMHHVNHPLVLLDKKVLEAMRDILVKRKTISDLRHGWDIPDGSPSTMTSMIFLLETARLGGYKTTLQLHQCLSGFNCLTIIFKK